ncbi:MAG: rhodanese-like domain-containing protein [Candidatus Saccharimonadales bacterium]|jgi:rhodanese-related sulfurtransferase
MSQKVLVIDTREPNEFAMSHVPGAVNISSMKFMRGLPTELVDTPKDQPIIMYCRSGQRSNTCIQMLKMHGFTDLTNGINEHHVAKMLV